MITGNTSSIKRSTCLHSFEKKPYIYNQMKDFNEFIDLSILMSSEYTDKWYMSIDGVDVETIEKVMKGYINHLQKL